MTVIRITVVVVVENNRLLLERVHNSDVTDSIHLDTGRGVLSMGDTINTEPI